MTVSVIVPTYQRCRVLMDRCIPSIKAQTITDWECHVVGDGTDEDTVAEMTALCAQDPRFRFTNLPHDTYPEVWDIRWGLIGLTAINHGWDTARGEWITVIGDDDEYRPNHHEVLLAAAERTGADFVYGISTTFKEGKDTGQEYGGWPPGDGAFAAYMFRTSLPYRFALDCWDRGHAGDADLWYRMIEGGVKFHFEQVLVKNYHRNWP